MNTYFAKRIDSDTIFWPEGGRKHFGQSQGPAGRVDNAHSADKYKDHNEQYKSAEEGNVLFVVPGRLLRRDVQGGEQHDLGRVQLAPRPVDHHASRLPQLLCLHPKIEVTAQSTLSNFLETTLFSQDGINGLNAPTFALYEFQSVIVSPST